ncbi:MAG: hypothetical protein WAW52_03200 [Methanothrix sp.]
MIAIISLLQPCATMLQLTQDLAAIPARPQASALRAPAPWRAGVPAIYARTKC